MIEFLLKPAEKVLKIWLICQYDVLFCLTEAVRVNPTKQHSASRLTSDVIGLLSALQTVL